MVNGLQEPQVVPMARDLGVPHELYPFRGHVHDLGDGVRMHYLDEGPRDGEVLLLVHGNPTWSFYWRELVLALRHRWRVVVVDHVGCGLSDKPDDAHYSYRLARRVADLGSLVDHLALDRVTLIAHDWGGMIGCAWATEHPDRLARLVLMNTAAFHMPAGKRIPGRLALARDSAMGAFLVTRLNAFARGASLMATSKGLPAAVRKAYCAPYDCPANRIATLRFVQDIPLTPADPSYELVSRVQERLPELADRPALFIWGLRDWVFDADYLQAFRSLLPRAEVLALQDAGHLVLEDARDEVIDAVRTFLEAPAASSGRAWRAGA